MTVAKFTFRKGLKDGLPIAIGYLSVSFAYGILAVSRGLPFWSPILISLTNFTGTGQFVGTDMLIAGAAFLEIAFTMFIINARYILMSMALSQRLSPKINTVQRMIIAFGNTDEIFAIAMSKGEQLNMAYLIGLILASFTGWVGGTSLGACFGGILPKSLLSAMGITLFAMYIAIIVPPMRKSKAVVFVVVIAAALSLLFRFTPALKRLPTYIIVIIVGIVSALAGSFAFPLVDNTQNEPPPYLDNTGGDL